MRPSVFSQTAGIFSLLAALSGFLYTISLVLSGNVFYSSIFLMLSGFFATQVFVALFGYLKKADGYFALWGAVLGVFGSLGAMWHGGYDLSATLSHTQVAGSLVLGMDPKGLLSFGLVGVSILVFSALMMIEGKFPRRLALFGYLLGLLMLLIYGEQVGSVDPASPYFYIPLYLEGFLVYPVWFIWLGAVLRRE